MRINEFVDDRKNNGGKDNFNKKFNLALTLVVVNTRKIFDPNDDIHYGRHKPTTINHEFSTFDEWREGGCPIIGCIGIHSRNDKHYVKFTDPRVINNFTNIGMRNVSKDPQREFIIDVENDIMRDESIINYNNDNYYDKDVIIYGDLISECADIIVNLFNLYDMKATKIKDY